VTLETLPEWAAALLEAQRVARLAYLDDGDRPRALPVTFALAEGAVWTAIDEKPKRAGEPARVRWLRRRPEVALVVDVYSDAWEELAWVQLLGRIAVLEAGDSRAAPGLDALSARYEQYRRRRPPGPLLCLRVERALWWRAADAP
jgi:PPOX class probable F420-dependent enzyme